MGEKVEEYSFSNSEQFANEVLKIVGNGDTDILDAVLVYAERHELEGEILAGLVKGNKLIRDKLEAHCEQTGQVIGGGARLPV